jgi:hypothetical protein
MTEQTKETAPFLPVVSITKVDPTTQELRIQVLNSPPEGTPPPAVKEVIDMFLNAALQLTNSSLDAMQKEIEKLQGKNGTTEEKDNE